MYPVWNRSKYLGSIFFLQSVPSGTGERSLWNGFGTGVWKWKTFGTGIWKWNIFGNGIEHVFDTCKNTCSIPILNMFHLQIPVQNAFYFQMCLFQNAIQIKIPVSYAFHFQTPVLNVSHFKIGSTFGNGADLEI